jgi:hypothetical protein
MALFAKILLKCPESREVHIRCCCPPAHIWRQVPAFLTIGQHAQREDEDQDRHHDHDDDIVLLKLRRFPACMDKEGPI